MKKPLSIIFWAIKLVYKLTPFLLISVIVTQIINGILPFVQNFYLSVLIDKILLSIKLNNNIWIKFLIILIIIRLLSTIFNYLFNLASRFQEWHLQKKLPEIFIKKISNLDYQHLENKETANLIGKVKENYNWSTREIYRTITWLIINVISFGTAIVLLIPRYWYLALLSVIIEIPGLFVDKKFLKKDWKSFNDTTESNRKSWWLHSQLSDKKNISELKINNSVDFLLKKYIFNSNIYINDLIKHRKERVIYDFPLNIIPRYLVTAICLFVVISDIRNGLITIGMFSFYSMVTKQVGDYFSAIATNIVSLTEQILHTQNFKNVMELEPIIKNGNYFPKNFTSPKIEFKNVSFKYPNSDRFVYKNLNLVINPNEEIAIVGENGAGKSTLVKLLCRFYDPTSGQILINDIDLREYDLTYWYKNLSYLGQEFNTYGNLSLKDNIAIGNPSKINDKKIKEALKKSDSDFFKKYKEGLDTLMSQQFGGEEPSWGQWQKIAIARIFYRNSPIMIFDEPTASIDAVAESKIFTHIFNEIKNKTLIIISHRFSTVRNAQKIIVIKDGEIVEQGTHEQLIKLNGLYTKSFSLQAKGYK